MGGSHQHLIISSINRSIPVNECQLLTAEAHGRMWFINMMYGHSSFNTHACILVTQLSGLIISKLIVGVVECLCGLV